MQQEYLAMRKAAFIHSLQLEKYHYPASCPFNTTRAGKTRSTLNSMGLLTGEGKSEVAPEPAERVQLKKFHSPRYLHILKRGADGRWDPDAFQMGIGTPDCPAFKDMYDYSVWVCGATLTGAKLILSGEVEIAFNPSGGLHHSGPELASGFCYMNDVALACTVLAEAGKRILYLDIDVHYGDGVANAFYERRDVMTMSFHENPQMLFPGTGFETQTGAGEANGYCVNVPLPIGTYDDAYLKAFNAIAVPLIGAYNPDVIVLQAGADALADDPLAHLELTNNAYAKIIKTLLDFDKPILAVGGGGYNIDNTVRAWARNWCVLTGGEQGDDTGRQIILRDVELDVSDKQRETVEPAVDAVIEAVKANVFSIHGL